MGLRDDARATAEALGALRDRVREARGELDALATTAAARRSGPGSIGQVPSADLIRGGGGGDGGGGGGGAGTSRPRLGAGPSVKPIGQPFGVSVPLAELEIQCELQEMTLHTGDVIPVYVCPWGETYPAEALPTRSGRGSGGTAGEGGQTLRERARERQGPISAAPTGGTGGGGSTVGFASAASTAGASSVVSELRTGRNQPTAGEKLIVAAVGRLERKIDAANSTAGDRARGLS